MTEGAVAPEQANADPALSPDFDPGGESEDLPFDAPDGVDAGSAPDPEAADVGPLEEEPSADLDVPVADVGDEGAETVDVPPAPTPTATPTPSLPQPEATAPPASSPTAEPSPQGGTPDTDPCGDTGGARAPDAGDRRREQREREAERPVRGAASPDSSGTQGGPSQPAVILAQTAPETGLAPTGLDSGSAKRGDRFHVVLPGESLWSISRDLVGSGASVASVAREVNTLWELNKTRIATGDPDLLMIGTRLTLR